MKRNHKYLKFDRNFKNYTLHNQLPVFQGTSGLKRNMPGRKRKHPREDDSVGTAKRRNVEKPKQKAKKSINTKGKQTATKNGNKSIQYLVNSPAA